MLTSTIVAVAMFALIIVIGALGLILATASAHGETDGATRFMARVMGYTGGMLVVFGGLAILTLVA